MLFILFFKSSWWRIAKASPKQQRRPLPTRLYLFFFCGAQCAGLGSSAHHVSCLWSAVRCSSCLVCCLSEKVTLEWKQSAVLSARWMACRPTINRRASQRPESEILIPKADAIDGTGANYKLGCIDFDFFANFDMFAVLLDPLRSKKTISQKISKEPFEVHIFRT